MPPLQPNPTSVGTILLLVSLPLSLPKVPIIIIGVSAFSPTPLPHHLSPSLACRQLNAKHASFRGLGCGYKSCRKLISLSNDNNEHESSSISDNLIDTTKTNHNAKYSKNEVLEPPFRGILRDYKARLPHFFTTDYTDGFNSQCLASIMFLFFACLAPAIGFGTILGAATGGDMGTIEMTLSTAICGVAYGLFSAQPMQLIGPMGPLVAYTLSLLQLSSAWNVPFLPLYAWTGLWASAYLFLMSATSVSNLMRNVTSFTDEIFSVLISVIFIWEALSNVGKSFASPAAAAASGAGASKALLTLATASLTFLTSYLLKQLPTTTYLTQSLRKHFANFAPALGVTAGSIFSKFVQGRFPSDAGVSSLASLAIPNKLATTSGRAWLVDLFSLPTWARWASALPAIGLSVLIFLDQSITARLVNHPRNGMVKGRKVGEEYDVIDGMHGDLMVMSLLTGAMSVFGLPWMGGATTRSAAHVKSLIKSESKGTSDCGGSIENRVTGTSIHFLIGSCIFFSSPRQLLSNVPLPALYGVFLYLGYTSLQGLELWSRTQELFQIGETSPMRRWGDVKKSIVNRFTLVQLSCVAVLMRITKSSFGVIMPLLIGLLPMARWLIGKCSIVPKKELDVLDEPAR